MIVSFSNPKIKQVIAWRDRARQRRKDGIFLAEGSKMFLEAPKGLLQEVFVSDSFYKKAPADVLVKLKEVRFEILPEDLFARICDTQTPQGILSVLRQPKYEAKALLAKKNPLFLVVENLQDPGNLGTIFRTAEGAGADGIFLTGNCVDLFNPKTIRSTMGSVYRVPYVLVEDAQALLADFKAWGIKTYAAHLKGETYYDTLSFAEGTAFFIGNEAKGLSDALADAADSYVKIPMEGQLESLNAAVAAALLMYEAKRQRK